MKTGHATIGELVSQLVKEKEMTRDFIVPTSDLALSVQEESQLAFTNGNASEIFTVNENAHRQISDRLAIPYKYYERMRMEYPELLEENVNGWFQKNPEDRMVRTLGGKVRAFLSNKYRRIDNLELMQAVYPVLQEMDGVNIKSCAVTDNHLYLQVVSERVKTEIVKGDIVQAGFVISNSETGLGAVSVQPMVYRLICANGLISAENSHRRYHTGKRIEAEENYEIFRDETKAIDDMAYFAKVQDIVRAAVNETRFNQQVIQMEHAMGIQIDPMTVTTVVKELGRTYTLKEAEQTAIVQNFLMGDYGTAREHIVHFNQFGLSNAVTKTANMADDYERAIELERLGGTILTANLTQLLGDVKQIA